MSSIVLVVLCLGSGWLFQRIEKTPLQMHQTLNFLVINFALPALTLYYIPKIKISFEWLYPLGIAWLSFFFSFVFFYLLGTFLNWSRNLIGALILTSGLANTSFIGFPITEALYGKEGLKTAIIVDQPGSFVVMATVGVLTAMFFSGKSVSFLQISKRILFFPPFIGFVLAVFLVIIPYQIPYFLEDVFFKIGSLVTPLALLSIGLQLNVSFKKVYWKPLLAGLFFKLLLLPFFFLIVYKIILKKEGLMIDVSLIESAMPPMITGALLASNYGLKPKLCSLMVGVGISLSFFTLAFWYYVISSF